MSTAEKLSFLPDDAFYYFELARGFLERGQWTFDRGRSHTSGFHIAFAYVCVLVQRALPQPEHFDRFLNLHATLGVIVTLAALAVLQVAARPFAPGRWLAILLVGCAGGIVVLPFQCMEWPFVLLVDAAVLGAVATGRFYSLGVLLVVGSTCRSDFPLLGASIAVAYLSMDPTLRRRETWMRAGVTLGATGLGALLVMAHTYAFTGRILQTSARTKSYWGSVMGYDAWYGFDPSSYAFSPGYLFTRILDTGPILLIIPMALLAGMYVAGRATVARYEGSERVLLRASVLALVGYGVMYGRIGTGAPSWYSAHFIGPMFVLVSALAAPLAPRAQRWMLVAAGVLAAMNIWDARKPMFNAEGTLVAAYALRDDPRVPLAASWNSGTWGYLGGEKVVNIDGLANDDILAYAKTGRLHCYLVHEQIPLIIDQPNALELKVARYLGFANGVLVSAMKPLFSVANGATVWSVDLAALARDPVCAEDLRNERPRRGVALR